MCLDFKFLKMTFPHFEDNQIDGTVRINSQMDIGEALKEVLLKALEAERITCGAFAGAKLLSSNPDNVSLCILPDVNPTVDVTVHIQHKLIEAYCWENDIPVLKVDSMEKLTSLCKTKTGNEMNSVDTSDLSCILIEYPQTGTDTDETISKFYNNILINDVYPRPIIDLPV